MSHRPSTYQSSRIAIDQRRQQLGRRRALTLPRDPYTQDGTSTVTRMLDAGEPVGPSVLAAAQEFVRRWRDVPPHWRAHEAEWQRRRDLILSAEAA